MQPAGQALVRFLDVVDTGAPVNAKDNVEVHRLLLLVLHHFGVDHVAFRLGAPFGRTAIGTRGTTGTRGTAGGRFSLVLVQGLGRLVLRLHQRIHRTAHRGAVVALDRLLQISHRVFDRVLVRNRNLLAGVLQHAFRGVDRLIGAVPD